MSESHTTTDHAKIKKWVDERDGVPATVKRTEQAGHAGLLRIDFGPKEENLEEISWDEFFQKFDEAHLQFLYQDKTKEGKISRFHKFVSADKSLAVVDRTALAFLPVRVPSLPGGVRSIRESLAVAGLFLSKPSWVRSSPVGTYRMA